jgi:Bacteriophage replication protein O
MSTKGKTPSQRYTQAPNKFFDDILPQIKTLAELKVTLVIMRKTRGWHKSSDRLSISKLKKFTGLSEQSVRNGIEQGMTRGTIARHPDGRSFSYSLTIASEKAQDLDPSKVYTSLKNRPGRIQDLEGQQVQDLAPQKKPSKRNPLKEKQPKLVAATPHAAEAISICREIIVRQPQPHQRKLIAEQVADLNTWRQILEQYAAEGRPPNRVDWMLERYHNAMKGNGHGTSEAHTQQAKRGGSEAARAADSGQPPRSAYNPWKDSKRL